MDCSHVYEIVQGKDYAYCDQPVPVTNGVPLTVLGNPFCSVHYVNNLFVTDME